MSDIRRLKRYEGKIREHYAAAMQKHAAEFQAVAAERDALKGHVKKLTNAQSDLLAENMALRAELLTVKGGAQ